jgi:pyruvate/2-oxoglutarate dehydrogenase complex dihydrolipoamide acyltransferase (E2) component
MSNILKTFKLFKKTSSLNNRLRLFSLTSTINNEVLKLKMPALSPTMTEGTIVKWNKKEGDKISPGDVLFEIQTDKAVLAYDTEEEGILAKILKQSDTNNPIQVGTIVGLIVGENDDWKNVKLPNNENIKQEKQQEQHETINQKTQETSISLNQIAEHNKIYNTKANTRIMGPAARFLIHNYNIDINKLNGTGPHGLITKRYLIKFNSKLI